MRIPSSKLSVLAGAQPPTLSFCSSVLQQICSSSEAFIFSELTACLGSIVSSMLILGGSATVTDLTGMNTIAACFLIPIGVAIYVVAGGMRATLLCDYTHTAVLFAIILTFIFTAYATSPKIGSPAKMHELLVKAATERPVSGNAHGSYLTMRSKNGLIFGVINIIGERLFL